LGKCKICIQRLHDNSEIANISQFDDFLQIYFIFAQDFVNFKSFLRKKAKESAKKRDKGCNVNEGKFVLNINVLFAL
jgi:hypothetical protein